MMEDPGPPKLLMILVQDEATDGSGPGNITDLLDTADPPACSATMPCPTPFTINFNELPGCDDAAGTCIDPLAAGPVGIGVPVVAGGTMIRIVFSKLLDLGAIEPGLVKLTDESGNEVPAVGIGTKDNPGIYWDPTGSPTNTFDPLLAPFGPALVVKPDLPLLPNARYTLSFDPSHLKDKQGQTPIAANLGKLPVPYTIDFTTQSLALVGATPDVTPQMPPTEIKPDDVIQLAFNMDVDETTAQVTLSNGMSTLPVEAWTDRGGNPSMCDTTLRRTLDLVAVSQPGTPLSLPDGNYTLTLDAIRDATGRTSVMGLGFTFAVKGPADKGDTQAVANFVLPEACNAPSDDGGVPADMGLPDGSPQD